MIFATNISSAGVVVVVVLLSGEEYKSIRHIVTGHQPWLHPLIR